jgi:hypothetical protein
LEKGWGGGDRTVLWDSLVWTYCVVGWLFNVSPLTVTDLIFMIIFFYSIRQPLCVGPNDTRVVRDPLHTHTHTHTHTHLWL